MGGFQKFLLRGNVVDLAVAVIIGAAFGHVVKALTKDIITPIIGIVGGVPDFSALSFEINRSRFLIGDFINAVLTFLIVAFVVYHFVVVPMTRLMERFRPDEAPAKTKECPECLSKVPAGARKCAFCASALTVTD